MTTTTMNPPAIQKMTRKEARDLMHRIRHGLRDCRLLILRLYEGQGWKALGYSSWRDCVAAEFAESERRLYQLLTAAQIDRELQELGDVDQAEPIPERQARELAKLPTAELRREVYAEAQADGVITAQKIADIVASRQGHSEEQLPRAGNSFVPLPIEPAIRPAIRDEATGPACWRVLPTGKLERMKDGDQAGARIVTVRPGDVVRLERK